MGAVENLEDLTRGVKALGAAIDGLSRIAAMGGEQGLWAVGSLREIHSIMVPAPNVVPLRTMAELREIPFEARR